VRGVLEAGGSMVVIVGVGLKVTFRWRASLGAEGLGEMRGVLSLAVDAIVGVGAVVLVRGEDCTQLVLLDEGYGAVIATAWP
jgi:hypothetical protein